MFRDLSSFLARLEDAGELLRIKVPVSPILEIATIVDRVSKSPCVVESTAAREFDPDHCDRGGKALLFEKVIGSDLPVAINVFGSYRRIEMALGVDEKGGLESIAAKLAALTKPEPPTSFGSLVAKAREVLPLLSVPPKTVSKGRCQEVVQLAERGEVDLLRLPILKCWPKDGDPTAVGYPLSPEQAGTAGGGGRYITFAGIHTIHARDAGKAKPSSHNIGMYRAQVIDGTHLVMHWHMHHDGAAHWRSWKAKGEKMPIALCLGGEAVLPYAATAPLPPGISELLMAGFLNGKGIELVAAKTVPLRVPANCEIVIEGYVDTDCGAIGFDPRVEGAEALGPGAAFEGPFGDHTGFYSLPDRYPIVEVTAITMRKNAIYPTTIVGLPPQEDYYLGKATERVFLPLLKTLVHDIADYHLPLFGCFHNCAFVKIHKAYPLQARRVMHSIWGAGQMAWTKWIVVVDDDVAVHDERAVLRAIAENCHFGRDVEVVRGPLDILDHAAPYLGAGGKIGFDATRKITGESTGSYSHDARSTILTSSTELEDAATALSRRIVGRHGVRDLFVPDYGGGRIVFFTIDKASRAALPPTPLRRRPGDAPPEVDPVLNAFQEIVAAAGILPAELVIAFSPDVPLRDFDRAWFHVCANFDPSRDRIVSGSRLGLDATAKNPAESRPGAPVRDWPPLLEHDFEVLQRVERRWGEYGL
jgi:4-hydroxy-3-polyprenylbenzoate decarboxylase